MSKIVRIFARLLAFSCAGAAALAAVVSGVYYFVEPGVPDAAEFREIRFQIPLSVYSRDGRLMAQIGEQVRTPVRYQDIPQRLVRAFLAAEDDRFFEHSGIDYPGTVKAIFNFITHPGQDVPGGSTITQQIPETMNFLSRNSTLAKKFKEWFLALRLEREFTKEEILELYLNTTFFGQRSYGVIAAARTYFNKELGDLTLSEMAILAGIPPAPSNYNPYNGPDLAAIRRAYVLRRLTELGWITETERRAALAEPIESKRYGQQTGLEADYVAEMVRAEMIRRFGPAAYTNGLKVTTTIDSRLQKAANRSLRETLIDYDRRHGYRGPVRRVDVATAGVVDETGAIDTGRIDAILADYGSVLDLKAGLVLAVDDAFATVYLRDLGVTPIALDAVAWARPYLTEGSTGQSPKAMADVLGAGDIVWFRRNPDGELVLGQLPEVQGAFVSLDPRDGAVVALTGGLDYFLNNYNRATQSLRQPGSSFKPFIYSAALEHGFTLATIINDAPIVDESPELERAWRPENFAGNLGHGETPLREALTESMNLAAIRTLRDVGLRPAISHLHRFGFDGAATPSNATLAIGGGNLAPIDLAAGYAVLANGGYAVKPYFIQRIDDALGDVLYDASRSVEVVCRPDAVERSGWCAEDEGAEEPAAGRPRLADSVSQLFAPYRHAERVVDPQNVYLITDILKDVIASGSGNRAYRELGRRDIAGKTGTTNGPRDAWFAGFNADVLGVAWVGFDDDRDMGDREQGGVTAIPMWIGFMREALAGQPEHTLARPPGIVEVRINPTTGLVASDLNPNAKWEIFEVGNIPEREPDTPYERHGTGIDVPITSSDEDIF